MDYALDIPSDDTSLWRYMDLSQFIHFLQKRTLRFSTFKEFEDLWEGVVPSSLIHSAKTTFEPISEERLRGVFRLAQPYLGLVNCWHENAHESVAMWNLYTRGKDGVAIQTTVGRVTRALATEPRKLVVGRVQYLNYAASDLPVEPNRIVPLFCKRISFQHEREVRLLLQPASITSRHFTLEGSPGGENVEVDTTILIQRIVASPTFPAWALDSLGIIVRTAGILIDIETSDLLKDWSTA